MRRFLETPDIRIPNLCAAESQLLRRRHQAFQLHRTASQTQKVYVLTKGLDIYDAEWFAPKF